MSCPDPNMLAALVDGVAADREAIEAHLDHCEACTVLFAELARALPVDLVTWRAAAPRTAEEIDEVWHAAIAAVAAWHVRGRVVQPAPARMFVDGEQVIAEPNPAPPPLPYRAPEQLAGGAPSAATDQFALCAGWWEARSGALPFRGATAGALAVAIEHRPAPPLGVDRGWYERVVRGLAARPDARWPDLDALLHARAGSRWIVALAAILAIAAAAAVALR
jgi:hypothetical protein